MGIWDIVGILIIVGFLCFGFLLVIIGLGIVQKPNINPSDKKLSFYTGIFFIVVAACIFLVTLQQSTPNMSNNPGSNPPPGIKNANCQTDLSVGNCSFFELEEGSDKDIGIKALANKNYEEAILKLQAALEAKPNDPEARIYYNNALIKDTEPYTIAVSVPIDPLKAEAEEILRGVAQAQDEINRKDPNHINGKLLKVIIANDDNDGTRAKEVATMLADFKEEEILGVVGHYSSSTTLAAIDTYNNKKLVAISPISTSVDISKKGGKYTFRTVPTDEEAAKRLAKYLKKQENKTKAAVFYYQGEGNSYSESLKNSFVQSFKENDGKVPESLVFDLSTKTNISQAVEKLNNEKADVIMLALPADKLDKGLEILSFLSAKNKTITVAGGDDVYSYEILKNGKEKAEGMILAVPWHIDAPLQTDSDFVSDSKDLWNESPVSWRTARSYDAAKALIEAIKKDPTRQGIQRKLSSGNDFSVTGSSHVFSFQSDGDRFPPNVQLVKVVKKDKTQYGYSFKPI